MQAVVLHGDERAQRKQHLAFEIHLQTGREINPREAFRQCDERRRRRGAGRGRRIGLERQLTAAEDLSADHVEQQGRLGRGLELESGGVLKLVTRLHRAAGGRGIRHDLDAVAPIFVADVGVRAESSLPARRDERNHGAGHAHAAEALGRTRGESQRGHDGQTAGVRLAVAEGMEAVFDEARDVPESRGLAAAGRIGEDISPAVREGRGAIHLDGDDRQVHPDIQPVADAHPGTDEDGARGLREVDRARTRVQRRGGAHGTDLHPAQLLTAQARETGIHEADADVDAAFAGGQRPLSERWSERRGRANLKAGAWVQLDGEPARRSRQRHRPDLEDRVEVQGVSRMGGGDRLDHPRHCAGKRQPWRSRCGALNRRSILCRRGNGAQERQYGRQQNRHAQRRARSRQHSSREIYRIDGVASQGRSGRRGHNS